ncbi:uncharacterized protein BDZ99DRAFT_467884 [Mytilinidion resinicola]|uniref:Uncharacterized protein n=1 Tax=Mytilinidion resinicola TaxID=574789 RepID=A0A6A6Y5F3_9PEZI|nr:uncharacterized protein BDZ99DRAFT_467884 [Mytilinidion resinicola]KAF2803753.1 hypothetical protein BDZ99DRAFT_467884 [Mytilinidion resinicola]
MRGRRRKWRVPATRPPAYSAPTLAWESRLPVSVLRCVLRRFERYILSCRSAYSALAAVYFHPGAFYFNAFRP